MSSKKKSSKAKSKRKLTSSQTPKCSTLSMAIQATAESIESSAALDIAYPKQELSSASQAFKITSPTEPTPKASEANDSKEQPEPQESHLLEGSELLVPEQVNEDSTTPTTEANDSKEQPAAQESNLLEGSELLVPEQVNEDSTTPTTEANDSKEQPEIQESQLLEGSELLVPEQVNEDSTILTTEANDSKGQPEVQESQLLEGSELLVPEQVNEDSITPTTEANDSKEQPEVQESQLLEGSELLVPEQVHEDSITPTTEANDFKGQPEVQESQLLEGSELLVPEQVHEDSTILTTEANDSKEQLEAQKEPEGKAQNTGGLKAKDESLDLHSSKDIDKPATQEGLVDVGSEDSSLSSIQDSELEEGSMTSLFAGSGLLMDFGSEPVESKAATSLTKRACAKGSKCHVDASQEHETEQGSLLVDGYIVGQGGLFDALEEENEPKLPSHPSNFDEFSDVLAPSENLPDALLSEAEESPYSILEPAFDFLGGSSSQSSSESSYSEESDPYASLDGNSLYNPTLVSSASAGAGAPMYMDSQTTDVQDTELDLAEDNLTESAQIDSALAKPEIGHIEAAVNQKSKQISDDGSIEDVENMADESKPKRKRASTKKVVFDPFIYPIDPKVNVVCGIDEAGRGPLMGDVVAACVILDHENMIPGLNDSKKLTEKARDALVPVIKEQAIAWGIGRASPQEIDELNILNATFLAMRRAYDAMHKACNLGLVDGNKIPKTFSDLPVVLEAVVKGDARVPEISAASILAKTARDADLYELDKLYPEYGFAHHKGYPTKDHLAVLQHLPILPCYRLSYGPIKKLLSNNPDYHEAISENVAHRMQEINQRQQAKLHAQEHDITLVSIEDFEH